MAVSLDKRSEASTDTLMSMLKEADAKGVDLGEVSAAVELAVDFSASMHPRYPKEVQELVERCLALSMTGLDDDQSVPVHFFHHDVFDEIVATPTTYQGLVADFASNNAMGSTNYGPFIRAITAKPPSKVPNLIIVVTDGLPGDKDEVTQLLFDDANNNRFWAFIGLGINLKFLKKLDTMKGRVVDNVSLTEARSLAGMDDDTFVRTVLDEWLTQWLPAARAAGITP